jgi:hypothetical protein
VTRVALFLLAIRRSSVNCVVVLAVELVGMKVAAATKLPLGMPSLCLRLQSSDASEGVKHQLHVVLHLLGNLKIDV